jgi:hypothetical protein
MRELPADLELLQCKRTAAPRRLATARMFTTAVCTIRLSRGQMLKLVDTGSRLVGSLRPPTRSPPA